MRFWNFRNKAFTLLECLVALLVISGSVLIIEGLSKVAKQEIVRSQDSSEKDWQIFCSQIRSELDGAKFDAVENNFLYVTSSESWRFGLPAGATDFRKSNANGKGYQPMLHDVKSVKITESDGRVKFDILFKSGGEKQFYYQFTKSAVEAESSSTP